MIETVLRKLEESGTILLQCAQKLAVLELDLILKAVAKIPDEVYVIFHFFLVCFFLQVASTLPGIDEGIGIFIFKVRAIHLIFRGVHSIIRFPRHYVIFITNCSRFFISLDLLGGY